MSTSPNDPMPPDPEHGPDAPTRKSAMPLVWLLVLIAAGAAIWYFANRSDHAAVSPEPVTPAAETPEPEPESGAGTPDTDATASSAAPPSASTARPPDAPVPEDRAAEPVIRIQPDYPVAALRSREQGTVLLRVEVDAQGNPASVEVESSSRSRELDRAARDAVLQWAFHPAIRDGEPVASTVTVPVDFRIGEQ